ncbi:MAG: hypothetical protein CMQ23_07420 [Gammaproteobacteria bacterium]|nr:hypothetical protein [Gammaproteobacteria bacterium]
MALRSHPISLPVSIRIFGCARLPIADGPEGAESPVNTGFLQKSFAYRMGLGYSAQPWREQAKKLFSKGL